MSKIRDHLTKGYIHLPGSVRGVTDPLVRNRREVEGLVKRRGEKGRQIVKKQLQTLLGHNRGKRRNRR